VVAPTLGGVDIQIRRHDVVVAGEDDGYVEFEERRCVFRQPLEPAQLIVEFWTRCRIPVRKIKAGHNHSVDGRFDIAAVTVIGVPWQAPSSLDRFLPPRKDGHAVPAFLSMPYCPVSGLLDLLDRKAVVW